MRKIVTLALISGAIALSACNTVRGVSQDLNSAANCTENTINGAHC